MWHFTKATMKTSHWSKKSGGSISLRSTSWSWQVSQLKFKFKCLEQINKSRNDNKFLLKCKCFSICLACFYIFIYIFMFCSQWHLHCYHIFSNFLFCCELSKVYFLSCVYIFISMTMFSVNILHGYVLFHHFCLNFL